MGATTAKKGELQHVFRYQLEAKTFAEAYFKFKAQQVVQTHMPQRCRSFNNISRPVEKQLDEVGVLSVP
jgi:hypothetical protein